MATIHGTTDILDKIKHIKNIKLLCEIPLWLLRVSNVTTAVILCVCVCVYVFVIHTSC